jgi:hypothetical protein
MFYRHHERIYGVLNDFDLTTWEGDTAHSFERTGTLPFMALDLLTPEGQDGKLKHIYQYDLESFMWVFIWITCRYSQSGAVKSTQLDGWLETLTGF